MPFFFLPFSFKKYIVHSSIIYPVFTHHFFFFLCVCVWKPNGKCYTWIFYSIKCLLAHVVISHFCHHLPQIGAFSLFRFFIHTRFVFFFLRSWTLWICSKWHINIAAIREKRRAKCLFECKKRMKIKEKSKALNIICYHCTPAIFFL